MRLILEDDNGEMIGEKLEGVELYDLGNRYWSGIVIDWLVEGIKGEATDG